LSLGRIAVVVVALLAWSSAAWAESAKVKKAVVVRERPGDGYRAVGKLEVGAKVEIARHKDGWAKISGGRGGWVPENALGPPGSDAVAAPAKAKRAPRVAKTRAPKRPKAARKTAKSRGNDEAAAEAAEAAYAAAEAEWSGEADTPTKTAPPPPAEEERRPPPRAQQVEEEPEPAAEEEPEPPPRRATKREVAQADDDEDERAPRKRRAAADDEGDDEPKVKKKRKSRKGDDDEERPSKRRKPKAGVLKHLFAMAGFHSWHEKVASATDNKTAPLSNYDVPVGSVGVNLEGGVGYRAANNFMVYADGAYRYFGANPGIKINITSAMGGTDTEALGVVAHAIDVGLRLGYFIDTVAVYGRVGWSSSLVTVGFSDNAPLPSEKLRAVVVGGGLEAPALGDVVYLRVRGDYSISPQRDQYANVDPYDSLLDGDVQTTVAWSAQGMLGFRVYENLALLLGVSYRFVDTQFSGPSERVIDRTTMQPAETDTKRTSSMLLIAGGAGIVW